MAGSTNTIHHIINISKIKLLTSITINAQIGTTQGVLDKYLTNSPADAARPVQRRGPNDRIGQIEHLLVCNDNFLAGQLQRTVDAYRIERMVFINLSCQEIAINHT